MSVMANVSLPVVLQPGYTVKKLLNCWNILALVLSLGRSNTWNVAMSMNHEGKLMKIIMLFHLCKTA